MKMKKPAECRYYFVDEAGDGTLFDARGRVLIGEKGVSRYFIVGVLDVRNPDLLQQELNDLRQTLLADPYFRKVPSMQPQTRKTALMFHAKDDVPEVRREVFALLQKHELRFLAVVRNKQRVLDYVRQRNAAEPSYRYHPNELYDYMVRILFKNLLHTDERYEICFSRRWGQDRTVALKQALQTAQARFTQQWGKQTTSTISVTPRNTEESCALQAVDYFLWSLQRFYERREDRYVELLWNSFRLVHDLDDVRKTPYGVYYTRKKPLTLAALDDDSPGI
jgi:hypothetical protein